MYVPPRNSSQLAGEADTRYENKFNARFRHTARAMKPVTRYSRGMRCSWEDLADCGVPQVGLQQLEPLRLKGDLQGSGVLDKRLWRSFVPRRTPGSIGRGGLRERVGS